MRVLLIAPQIPPYGGMALQAELLVKLLKQDGIAVTFLASNLDFPPSIRFLEDTRGLRAIFRIMLFLSRLWRRLADAQVVHIFACSWLYFFAVVCPAVLVSRVRGRRIVLNYRGGAADDFLRKYRVLAKPLFRMADMVTAPSSFLVDVLGKHTGVPVQIVPNIVDLESFRYRERKPVRPRMVVTRRLEKLYDVECVIRCFAEVQLQYPDASLDIAGTGDQEDRLRRLVAELKLRNVEFLGYVQHDGLPALHERCDILLNASHADNFPASLMEGAASGLVVISTNVGGIPYLFEHEKSALLFSPGDYREMARAVCRVLRDTTLASQLAREAERRCRPFEWDRVRHLLYRAYGLEASPQPRASTGISPPVKEAARP